MTADAAKITAPVGMNMGVYNGVVAACLLWLLHAYGLVSIKYAPGYIAAGVSIIIAGIFGGFTIKADHSHFPVIARGDVLGLLWRTAM